MCLTLAGMAGPAGASLHVAVCFCPHQRLVLREEARERERQGVTERERLFFRDFSLEFARLHSYTCYWSKQVTRPRMGKRLRPSMEGTVRQFARCTDMGRLLIRAINAIRPPHPPGPDGH